MGDGGVGRGRGTQLQGSRSLDQGSLLAVTWWVSTGCGTACTIRHCERPQATSLPSASIRPLPFPLAWLGLAIRKLPVKTNFPLINKSEREKRIKKSSTAKVVLL